MRRSIPFFAFIAFTCTTASAQMNIGSNNAPDSSAMLQISGTTKGILLPRMSQSDMQLIYKPAKGLMVFNTTDSAMYLRRDSGWTAFGFGNVRSASVVSANGVSGTVANASTTPAITLTLNNITPASVAATGNISGSNLSGTNTGDETNATLKAKLGAASASGDGYLTQADWIAFNSKPDAGTVWNVRGNAGTSSATDFIGTTDNNGFRVRTNNVQRMIVDNTGNVGIGQASPTAALHLKAGTSSANTAPLKLTSGTSMTTPEDGAIEYDGANYYVTSGTTRYTLAKTLTTTTTVTFIATLPNTSSSAFNTVSVPGASVGDIVEVGIPAANGGSNGYYTGYVSAANTVTVRFHNNTTLSLIPASGTFRITVLKY